MVGSARASSIFHSATPCALTSQSFVWLTRPLPSGNALTQRLSASIRRIISGASTGEVSRTVSCLRRLFET